MIEYGVLGFLVGVFLGKCFSFSEREFSIIGDSVLLGLVICLGLLFRAQKYRWRKFGLSIVSFILMFFWGAIHNPSKFENIEAPGRVIWSRGCGNLKQDILILVGEHIYLVHGNGIYDDVVVLKKKRIFYSEISSVSLGSANSAGFFCRLSVFINSKFNNQIRRFPNDIFTWIRAFVLGDGFRIDSNVTQDFKKLGILHLLVLSGGHLAALTTLICLVLRMFFLPGYIFKRLNCRTWINIFQIQKLFSISIIFIFCVTVGFTPSIQRAFFTIFCMFFLEVFGIFSKITSRIHLSIFMAAIFYPVNFFSMSMILSWSGSLLLMSFSQTTFRHGFIYQVLNLLKLQFIFFISSWIFFGSVGVLSPIANLMLQPVFSLILPLDLIVILLDFECLDRILVSTNRGILSFISSFSRYQETLPIGSISMPSFVVQNEYFGRILILGLVILFYLGCRRKIQTL